MPNSISEWFGHRIYPTVCGAAAAQAEQRRYSCPFLTRALNATSPVQCVKAANSRGVCTVSSNSNGTQQDWVVCPYRTIDSEIFAHVSRRLFSAQNTVELIPAPRLAIAAARRSLMERLERHQTALVLFMDKLGGEIDLPGSRRSPKFKLDTTIVELSQDQQGQLQLGRYAVIEVQTMDFHGTYRHATTSLTNALKLHPRDFPKQLAQNHQWASDEIEGPNIANVFKRTIYQILFKLRLGHQADCAGCVLALPQAVWESWLPHLGAPTVRKLEDGTWALGNQQNMGSKQPGWLTIFDILSDAKQSPNPIVIKQEIRIDADALSRLAFEIAPEEAMQHIGGDIGLKTLIRHRLESLWPEAFKS